jgi:N-methylhydantoinase B/oxoprolinase/acetone carboxylase alpha subunit
LKCVLDPESPNNDGSQRAIRLIAPEGSIVNHVWPYSGGNRALVGHYLPALVLRALADAIPDRVIAPTGSPIWSFLLRGQRQDGSRFALKTFFNGGMGATAHGVGETALSWPSNVSSTPVEVIEQQAPIRVLHRRIRRDSGGQGLNRGGDGLGSVEIWDSQLSLFVIQALDGSLCIDCRPMGEDGTALPG